ncbi:MAG: ACT domain-containing protein [Eubacterium sp.]|nr:ACT domain-containing protein [Candidatus Colimonas fimequi]
MRAVVTVVGKDTVGILANVSTACAEMNVSVDEVTQSILNEYFCLIMLVSSDADDFAIEDLKNHISGKVPEMQVHVMHEDIFNSMHRI